MRKRGWLAVMLMGVVTVSARAEAPPKARLADRPPMGWNSWAAFKKDIDEQNLRAQADALVSMGLRDAGYVYFVIDGGWKTSQRDAQGNLVVDPKKFPSGMKALADYVHARGLKFGLHQPAGIHDCGKDEPGSQGNEERDAALFASWGLDFIKYDQCDYIHDPSRVPGSPDLDKVVVRHGGDQLFAVEAEAVWNHVSGLARVEDRPRCSGGKCVAGIGLGGGALEVPGVHVSEDGRYTLEVDYSLPYYGQNRDRFKQMTFYVSVNGGERWRVDLPYDVEKRFTTGHAEIDVNLKRGDNTILFDNPNSQEEDVRLSYLKMATALQGTGREVMFSISGGSRPWLWGQPLAHLWRTASDLSDHWSTGSSILRTLDRQLPQQRWSGPGFWADPDALQVGLDRQAPAKGKRAAGLSDAEAQAHLSLWATLGAPLFISADLRDVDDASRRMLLNRDVIAVDQDPLGVPGQLERDEGNVQIFTKRVVDGVVVAILNRGEADADVRVTQTEVGMGGGTIDSHNLWTGEHKPVEAGAITSRVGSHAVVLLRLTPSQPGR